MSIHSWEVPSPPILYPCTLYRSFTEVWFRSDSPFSVAPSEQLGSQEELLRLHPLGQVGEVRVDNPAVGCSDVLNIYKETLSRRLMANSLIISTSLVRESEVIDDQSDSLVKIPFGSGRQNLCVFRLRLRLVKTKHRRRRSTERCASRNMSCAWWPINATASRREVGASRCGAIGWTGFFDRNRP